MPDNTVIKLGEYSLLETWLGLYYIREQGFSSYKIKGIDKGLEVSKVYDLFSDAEEFFNSFILSKMGVGNV